MHVASWVFRFRGAAAGALLAACVDRGTILTPGSSAISAISAGGLHSCALTPSGAAWCWGANNSGQLGIGTADNAPHTAAAAVTGGHAFITISAGFRHTCGVTTVGTAYCWGANAMGQLGIGTQDTVAHGTPELVAGGLTFSDVRAGLDHTCGITIGGAAYCWGANAMGQLGIGTQDTVAHAAPVPVAGGLAFATLAVGGGHSCATTLSGAAWCWGDNGYGEIGDSTSLNFRPSPVAVTGGLSFAALGAAGDYLEGDLNGGHTCGLTTGGAAYCWGLSGQKSPAPAGGPVFAQIATFDDVAGGAHVCALTPAGAAWCWGSNYDGQLGDSTQTYRAAPTPVAGGLGFVAISAGGDHSCGVTSGGAWYCWGGNLQGCLGTGEIGGFHATPARVVGQP